MKAFLALIARRPRRVLVLMGAIMAAFACALPLVRWDNRPDSFMPRSHPAYLAKRLVEERFGLEDPMLLAVVTGQPRGIFREAPLRLIASLTEEISRRLASSPAAAARPVYSLATELDVELEGGILHETPFLAPFPETEADFRRLEAALARVELYDGVLIAGDGSASAIIVMPPEGEADEVSRFVADLAARRAEPGIRLVLAGEAAVRSAMGRQVTLDALRLNPLCVLIVAVFLALAFRNATGVILPFLVVGWGSVVMLGAMALAGSPVYIITNAILVTVVSLGVADTIPVLAEYYRELGLDPGAGPAELALRATNRLWLPVAFTCITDMAGFLSFLLTGVMPPLEAFGLFTAIGCAATLVASLTILPACLALIDPARPSQARRSSWAVAGPIAGGLRLLGERIRRRPRGVSIASLAALALGLVAARGLRVDQSMESAFDEESEIVQANRLVNRLFHGTYFLDVLLEAERPGAFLDPALLRQVQDLEEHAKALPHVNGSISIAGFARKLNQILHDWDPAELRIPPDAETVKEHFSLLDASPSKKADFLRAVSPDYRTANVRLRLSSGWYRDERPVVEALEAYLRTHFPPGGPVRGTLAGRVNMDVHWMRLIVESTTWSVLSTLSMVLILLVVLFRSVAAGLLSVVPVAMAVAATFATMALSGIDLSIGTSMFAALAMGVGINFPIHVLERLRITLREEGLLESEAFGVVFSLTGKALLFDALAVSLGFLALVVSDLPILRHFGLMIAMSIATASVASLITLPALVAWLRPRFLYGPGASREAARAS
jgi:predicted RND superfamily exporter protein